MQSSAAPQHWRESAAADRPPSRGRGRGGEAVRDDARAAARGDEAAFARLVRALSPALYRFVLRFAPDSQGAEDLVQEAWIRVHRALSRYDPARPFRPWLYRIASNLAVSAARRRRRRPAAPLPEVGVVSGRPGGAALAAAADEASAVRAAVDTLPPLYRAVVVLFYLEDLDLADMAEALELPIGTAKVRLHRARKLLRGRLARCAGDADAGPIDARPTGQGREGGER